MRLVTPALAARKIRFLAASNDIDKTTLLSRIFIHIVIGC